MGIVPTVTLFSTKNDVKWMKKQLLLKWDRSHSRI